MNKMIQSVFLIFLVCLFSLHALGNRTDDIYKLGIELEKLASSLALNSYQHFEGWNGVISDQEQAVLFKSEAFSASCRLFLKMTAKSSGYFRSGYLRTNLYNAFIYLSRSFKVLEKEMTKARVVPYEVSRCRDILDQMDYAFSRWPSRDNLAYLHRKYIKARDDTVYMIERRGPGDYIRRPFKDLESLYYFNYSIGREKAPWDYLEEISENTLMKMEQGTLIELTFEGCLIIEKSSRRNRSVFLIENGKKRGVTSPRVLERLGGWDQVYEVPKQVIDKYPEGQPIK
ncbi:MAG: hypothetical protein GF421_12435 [Candidatus Aminicenantes bacterium]|nr:hypothetical protein [Candidatus Aminicenantes bacterium]